MVSKVAAVAVRQRKVPKVDPVAAVEVEKATHQKEEVVVEEEVDLPAAEQLEETSLAVPVLEVDLEELEAEADPLVVAEEEAERKLREAVTLPFKRISGIHDVVSVCAGEGRGELAGGEGIGTSFGQGGAGGGGGGSADVDCDDEGEGGGGGGGGGGTEGSGEGHGTIEGGGGSGESDGGGGGGGGDVGGGGGGSGGQATGHGSGGLTQMCKDCEAGGEGGGETVQGGGYGGTSGGEGYGISEEEEGA